MEAFSRDKMIWLPDLMRTLSSLQHGMKQHLVRKQFNFVPHILHLILKLGKIIVTSFYICKQRALGKVKKCLRNNRNHTSIFHKKIRILVNPEVS